MVSDALTLNNPLDQLLDPFGDSNRTYGSDILKKYAITSGRPGVANSIAGLGLDIVTDPIGWGALSLLKNPSSKLVQTARTALPESASKAYQSSVDYVKGVATTLPESASKAYQSSVDYLKGFAGPWRPSVAGKVDEVVAPSTGGTPVLTSPARPSPGPESPPTPLSPPLKPPDEPPAVATRSVVKPKTPPPASPQSLPVDPPKHQGVVSLKSIFDIVAEGKAPRTVKAARDLLQKTQSYVAEEVAAAMPNVPAAQQQAIAERAAQEIVKKPGLAGRVDKVIKEAAARISATPSFDIDAAMNSMSKKGFAESGNTSVYVVPHPEGGFGVEVRRKISGKSRPAKDLLGSQFQSVQEAQAAAIDTIKKLSG